MTKLLLVAEYLTIAKRGKDAMTELLQSEDFQFGRCDLEP